MTHEVCECGHPDNPPCVGIPSGREKVYFAALNSLTQIGTTPDGGIVVGPRGWDIAQEAINRWPVRD